MELFEMDKWDLPYTTSVDDSEKGREYNQKEMDDSKGALDPSVESWGLFHCHVCDVSGSGLITYEEHLNDELHLKSLLRAKVKKICARKKEMGKKYENEEKKLNIVKKSHGRQFDKSSSEHSSANGKHFISLRRPHDKYSLYFCRICNVKISGRFPFLQHLGTTEHKQKESQIIPGDKRVVRKAYDSSDLPFYCSLCDVPTPGPVSYQQHIMGRPHRLTEQGKFSFRDRMALRRKHVKDNIKKNSKYKTAYWNIN